MSKQKISSKKRWLKGIEILHEDRDILVVDKPPGLLTMGTDRDKIRTAYYILTNYVRKGCAKSNKRIYIVHRLDRDASGILVFAKNERSKFSLQDQWSKTEKKYLAVVYGKLANKARVITSRLVENKARMVYSTHESAKGRLSHTAYKVLKETKMFSLLEIDLITGRKNQIRVHLAEKGHPIVGDKKYGKRHDSYKRLALHAKSLSFEHPFSGKRSVFETSVPGYFLRLIENT